MMLKRSASAEAGFTIVELLVALCILALVSNLGLAALQNIRRMNALVARMEGRSAIEAVQNHLHNLLSAARPVVAVEKGPQSVPLIAFSGEEARLELIAAADGTLETGGLYSVVVETRRREDGLLDLVTRRRLPGPQLHRPGQALILLERIAVLKFRYFGPAAANQRNDWHNSWINRDTLPRLIEVAITLPTNDSGRWPRLLIRPASAP